MGEFLMPSLGADMEAGTLIEWEKNVGDAVARGDIIAVVETQKGAIEIEVFESGILESQLVEIGKPVPVGTPLALIGSSSSKVDKTGTQDAVSTETVSGDQSVSAPSSTLNPAASTTIPTTKQELSSDKERSAVTIPQSSESEYRQLITPVARRRAVELGMDIAQIQGTGPQNAIVLKDVESTASDGHIKARDSQEHIVCSTTATTGPIVSDRRPVDVNAVGTGEAIAGMRAAISAAMTRSKRDIPHYYLSHTVDLTRAEQWLAAFNTDRDASDRVLMGVLFLKAVALAAVKYPEFNGYFDNGEFTAKESVHAGMAINLRGGGLVAPAIHDTEKLDAGTLMVKLRDLIMRVRAGRFRAAELSDSTLTVSSLGERGVNSLYGVIYPPQVCLVGFGTPVLRPWVDESGGLSVRKIIDVTLAADHRVSDGHRGALFLNAIQKTLENPEAI